MKLNQYKPVLIVSIISIVLFVFHKTILFLVFPNLQQNEFVYSILLLYTFFSFFSILLIFIMLEINKKSTDNVGFTFMFLTSLKMGIAYFFMQPILNSQSISSGFEKINFFFIFILFLLIETTVTIRILNKKY